MPARAMWKGVIQLGRVSVPVKLYSAVQDRSVHFHILEQKQDVRIKQEMVNPETNEEVPKEQIQRAYEVEKGVYVPLSTDELTQLEPPASRDIEPLRFVPPDVLGHAWFDRPYYLGPDDDPASYFAFVDALDNQNRVGLMRWVMRKKQYLGAVKAERGYLMLFTLHYAEEVLAAQELPKPEGKALDAKELAMARQLISVLEGAFAPEEYHDEYRERVLKFVEEKAQGKKPKLAVIPKKEVTDQLTSALEASLKALKAPAKGQPDAKPKAKGRAAVA
ncbi:MAG: Ku protein [Bryobacterales bacterium]|nr:Ku protein [Bryobacterales bacterium]